MKGLFNVYLSLLIGGLHTEEKKRRERTKGVENNKIEVYYGSENTKSFLRDLQ